MQQYEFTLIFDVRESGYNSGLEAVKSLLNKYEFSIQSEEDLKERDLAYPIRKQKRGHYHFLLIEGDGLKLVKFDEELRLIEKVMRTLIVKREEKKEKKK